MDARKSEIAAVKTVSKLWWLWLVVGVLWVMISIVILQFDAASATTVGIIWIIEAFLTKDGNELWWLNLVAGILMVVLGFWLGGQFFFAKAETLLVFAGIWALMRGIIDVITAFQVKKLGSIGVGS